MTSPSRPFTGIRLVGVLLLAGGLAACGLVYFLFVERQQQYLVERNFRVLTSIGSQVESAARAEARVFENIARDKGGENALRELWKARYQGAQPHIPHMERARARMTVVRQDASYQLSIALSNPSPPQPSPTSVPPARAPAAAAAPAPGPIGFEERFGTRWVVWVGGVALALGGVFLVRYTIQQGLIGPGVRIVLGALLAAALVAAGEWARRKETLSGLPGLPSAHIPSVLSAAGTTVAYATVYAAYALYGFLPPAAAFLLLGVVALLTLAAALLHGPALAGLGVVGAFVTPMLIASAEPDYWSLYIYIAVVTAAAFALARARLWQWLAVTAIAFSAAWTLPGMGYSSVAALGAHVFNGLAGFVLAAALLVCGLLYGPSAKPGEVDPLSSLALAVYLLVATLLVLASRHDPVALTAFVVLTVATIAVAWRTEAAAGAVAVAAILAAAVMAHWAVQVTVDALIAPAGLVAPTAPEPVRYEYGWHLALAAAWSALFGIAGFAAQGRSPRALVPMLWCASGVFVPLAMLVALYYRITGFDRSLPFAGLALLLAAIFALATETLVQRERRPGLLAAGAMFATGTLAALALALTFALEKGWLTIALALMAPAAAWVAEKRPLPWLRWLAAIMVAIVVARIADEPRVVGSDLGTTPIFNWLLYGYGIPALSFWVAGWLLRRRADCRHAWSMPGQSSSPSCSSSWKSATTSPAATSTSPSATSLKPRSTSMPALRSPSASSACAGGPAASCTMWARC
jgi:uncharacterized membrane protein